jgi:RHS repeat-associated protein
MNRQSVTKNGVATSYTADPMNQYTNVGGTALVYDGNFNLTGYGTQTTAFDAENRLISVTGAAVVTGAGQQVASLARSGSGDSRTSGKSGNDESINGGGGSASGSFVYDGLGRCVKRTINGAVRLFTYDDWKPMLEWDGSGNWMAWNIYGAGADEILARYDTYGYATIYKQDARGNVVALLNQSGTVVEKYTYDAFGKPTILSASNAQLTTSAVGNRFMFQGREYLSELGLYDYRHRVYHPGLGRFLQTDPKGFDAGDMNLFRYTSDDPVDRSDPMGLDDSPVQPRYPSLTSSGGGDWIKGSDDLSAWDWNHKPQAGMDGGGGSPQDGGSKSISGDSEGPKASGKPGSMVQVKRSNEENAWAHPLDGRYINYVPWILTVSKDGKPVGQGVRVDEKVSFSNAVDAPLPGKNRSYTTNEHGQTHDTVKISFSSPKGHVLITQELIVQVGGQELRGRWSSLVGANGEVTPIREGPGNDGHTMILH